MSTRRNQPSSTPSPRSPEESPEVIEAEFVEVSVDPRPESPAAPQVVKPRAVRAASPTGRADELDRCERKFCAVCGAPRARMVSVFGPLATLLCERCERIGRLAASLLG